MKTQAKPTKFPKPWPLHGWRYDLVFATGAMLLLVTIQACIGFPSLTDTKGDNDSLLRLVEVRDLLGGQGWFDLHQYRMGPQGGFVMHWSRLVDAPIASIILALKVFGASESAAEMTAEVIWPALLYFANVFVLIRAGRLFGGENAVLPAAVIGAAALYFLGIFSPNSLDHHNVQLVLACGALYLAIAAPEKRWAACGSGVCAGLMLAVGMETVPYVAALGVSLALLFLVKGVKERLTARDFGLGFAASSTLVLIATVPGHAWGPSAAACDAFSSFQFTMAMLAGGGLAAICSVPALNGTVGRRLISLMGLAAMIGAVLVAFFPQCLEAPYGNVDPRLKQLWFSYINEAQSLWQLLLTDKASVMVRYATPALAMVLMALRWRCDTWRRQDTLVAALLVVAFAVSAWQVRGSTFSIAFATIPLSAWIGVWRERAERHPSWLVSSRMAAVWIVSVNASWTAVAATAATIENGAGPKADATGMVDCTGRAQYVGLTAEPPTTVLSVSNLGSPIVTYTGHRALAALYHRNIAGDLLALNALLGSAAEAKAIVTANHVGIIALCPGDAETRLLAEQAPAGFLSDLTKDIVPAWLEPIAATMGQPLRLYRVR